MTILEAKKEHLSIIKDLAFAIWPVAYAEILSKDQLDYMLDKFYSIPFLENQMNTGQVFVLAEQDGIYSGFASYELNCIDTKTKIHKLYVLPTTQGTGLGKKFVEYIKLESQKNNNTGVFLNVNRFNTAVEFYKKQNFIISETVNIEIGNGFLMEDYVMELLF
ncbi:MAG: GNAT family N-acetyltransferase [Flavobacterium sp.]|nr:GNAT family N-acetyltransferase [Flavobacterium sp.]